MNALAIIVFCVAAGMITARVKHPDGLSQSLNWWVVYMALPALVMGQIVKLEPSWELVLPGVSMWLVFFGAWLLMALVGAWLNWSKGLVGCMVLTAGLGNTAFVGYPLVEALMGKTGLAIAVITDQFGSFLMLTVMGAVVTAVYSGQKFRWSEVAKRLISFPPFIALMAAIVLGRLPSLPPVFFALTDTLGATMVPLALFSVGLQLKVRSVGGDTQPLFFGLGWKLFLAPLVVWGLLTWMQTPATTMQVVVLQSAMAPMVTGGILAQQHGFAPNVASRMVGLGLLISLFTVPLWQWILVG